MSSAESRYSPGRNFYWDTEENRKTWKNVEERLSVADELCTNIDIQNLAGFMESLGH